MRSLYFIADFSYNPAHKEPLKIFELGDALASQYPDKLLYQSKRSARELLIADLEKRYPDALFIRAYQDGLNITDLGSKKVIKTYDKHHLFNESATLKVPSYNAIIDLLVWIMQHAPSRLEGSKALVLYLGYLPALIPSSAPKGVSIINLSSDTLYNALFYKSILHLYAQENPLYPKTLLLQLKKKEDADNSKALIKQFMQDSKSTHYVLKPTDGTRSEHVHIIPAEQLQKVIKQIKTKTYKKEEQERYHQSGLLIQSAHLSKPITYKNQLFYGKGRAMFRADFSDESQLPTLTMLTAYWRTAKNSLSGNPIDDDTVITNPNNKGTVEIDPEDLSTIEALFLQHLPPLLDVLDKEESYISFFQNKPMHQNETPQDQFTRVFTNFFSQQRIIPEQALWRDHPSETQLIKELITHLAGVELTNQHDLTLAQSSANSSIKNTGVTFFEQKKPNLLAIKKNDHIIQFALLFLLSVGLTMLLNPDNTGINLAIAFVCTLGSTVIGSQMQRMSPGA